MCMKKSRFQIDRASSRQVSKQHGNLLPKSVFLNGGSTWHHVQRKIVIKAVLQNSIKVASLYKGLFINEVKIRKGGNIRHNTPFLLKFEVSLRPLINFKGKIELNYGKSI